MRLQGKKAIVTGAAYGNGRGIAVRFAEEGADVLVADVNMERANETKRMIEDLGRRAVVTQTDVRKRDQVEAMVRTCVAELGGVDIAVANAGVAGLRDETGMPRTFLDLTDEAWDFVIDTNLRGVWLTCQAAGKAMVEQGRGGRLINIASIYSEVGSAGAMAYCTSKGGVRMMTKIMAIEAAPHHITVNAIGPGFIETGMTEPLLRMEEARQQLISRIPAGRLGVPRDIANVALFLASDEAEYMTGTIVFADGGYLTQ
ncbi:MAG TPA: SDR family NAD(P)-dependent oxidoreductase [Dehalococcoidia bacterium]|nr:SDR family NAD(P)-dependent oxidoreductase [Dehalococcoidia bacterium]